MFSGISVSKDTVVRLLTIVFTPIATGGCAWLAKHGVNLSPAEVTTVGGLSGAAVLGLGFHWLQKQPAVLKGEQDIDDLADKVAASVRSDPALSSAISSLADKLDANKSEILGELDKHAPASVQAILQQLLAAASANAQATPVPVDPAASPSPFVPPTPA